MYVSLRKFKPKGTTITAQNTKNFWKPISGYCSKMRPDIVMNKDKTNCIVLDTKWKHLHGHNPTSEDLRQMFVYMKFYSSHRAALIYPGNEYRIQSGTYYHEASGELGINECSVISIAVNEDIRVWQKQLYDQVCNFFEFNEDAQADNKAYSA